MTIFCVFANGQPHVNYTKKWNIEANFCLVKYLRTGASKLYWNSPTSFS